MRLFHISRRISTTLLMTLGATSAFAAPSSPMDLSKITLPKGFKIELVTDHIPGARSMALGEKGTLFVGTREAGVVYAIPGVASAAPPPRVITIAKGLNEPNGVAVRNGSLYIAEVSRVLRYDQVESSLEKMPKPVVVNDSFPKDLHHGWKYIAFGPDGRLYVPVGAPCNVCESKDPRYASILSMKADGTDLKIFASGIRNTVGFDWSPQDRTLWFTDNGRDWLGDNLPPDELNHAPRPGMNFGFPYCYGKNRLDPEFAKKHGGNCAGFEPSAQDLGPHVASLGMKFYRGNQFPAQYHGQVFIAEHGSWNRTQPIGYRVSLVRMKDGRPTGYEVFAEGWLNPKSGEAWGRPVDVLELPDGSLLVSDDKAGAIYRIRYSGV